MFTSNNFFAYYCSVIANFFSCAWYCQPGSQNLIFLLSDMSEDVHVSLVTATHSSDGLIISVVCLVNNSALATLCLPLNGEPQLKQSSVIQFFESNLQFVDKVCKLKFKEKKVFLYSAQGWMCILFKQNDFNLNLLEYSQI